MELDGCTIQFLREELYYTQAARRTSMVDVNLSFVQPLKMLGLAEAYYYYIN